MDNKIGKIIRGMNQLMYLVQISSELESQPAPTPHDCAFSSFVMVENMMRSSEETDPEDRNCLVGLIIDSLLIDRDALRAGPRLAPDFETINIAYPDFIDERIKAVQILLIGWFENGRPVHEMPEITPHLGDPVYKMSDDEVRSFHMVDGVFKLGYYPHVLSIDFGFNL
ncbi:MAG: hypothetical protein ACTSXP_12845, partial [Promethearchaeota archaeon]